VAIINHIEAEMRALTFEAVTFYRNHAEGFENAYVLTCAPFLGWRGGQHVDGEHTLSLEDRHYGHKFDDVLYRNTHLGQESHGGSYQALTYHTEPSFPKTSMVSWCAAEAQHI
jgi:hypothetical protein